MAMSPEGFYILVMDVLSLWKQPQPRSVTVYHIYPTLRFESITAGLILVFVMCLIVEEPGTVLGFGF